jgi:hypothetical protein
MESGEREHVMLRGAGVMRELPRRARRFEPGIPRRPCLFGATGETVGGCDVADGTMQAVVVVLRDEGRDVATRDPRSRSAPPGEWW